VAKASRPSSTWNDDDFDVLAGGVVVGGIFKANAAPLGSPWMWTLAFGHHEDRTPTHGYEATREAANGRVRQELAAGVSPAIFASSRVKHRTDDGSRNAPAWIAREGQCPSHRAPPPDQAANSPGVLPSARLARGQSECVMDWNRIAGNWKQFKGQAKEKWGRLTDDDLDVINGRQDQLEGKIQERYGLAKDQAKKDVENWFNSLS
jgi:uncharacterized protein YjbJ (UPF0337 family)